MIPMILNQFLASNVVCMSSGDLLICRILNFELRIFVFVYFQLLKTSLKLRKREFYWPTFFCLTNKKFPFSVKRKRKQILRNIRTSKFKIRQISKPPGDIHTTLSQDNLSFFWLSTFYYSFNQSLESRPVNIE